VISVKLRQNNHMCKLDYLEYCWGGSPRVIYKR